MVNTPLSEMAPFDTDRRRFSVLLVDDDESVAEMSAIFLQRELDTVETTILTDPTRALAELREHDYDCIVCDFDMPNLDGLNVLSDIRGGGIDLPFILFTGKGSEEIASKAITAGVDEYLQKGGPEEYPVLANKIENLVEKYWAEAQVRRGFSAIESAEEGIGIIDDEGVYQYMNAAYAEVYNHDRSELIGEHWEVLYPDEEARRFRDEILPRLESEGAWRGVSTGLTKEGSPVPERLVLTQMEDGGHVCIVQALSEDDEPALTTRAVDAADAGIFIVDVRREHKPIVYLNEAFEDLTGYDEDELLGRTVRSLWGMGSDPETLEEIRSAIDRGESISTDVLAYDADGTPLRTRLELFPIESDDGRPSHVVGFQRKRPDSATDSSELDSNFEWLGEFGRVLSHDLKTPLSVLRGNLKLAAESGDIDRIENALVAATRLDALINDLSNVMSQGALVNELEAVELEAVFRSLNISDTGETDVGIVDSTRLLADESALARLGENLLKNTVEHGGTDVAMRVGTLPDGFYYEDDGPGIAPENREKAFKPGVTTKADGTGLGLVSVRQISLAHGWKVSLAESAEGGVRFEFTGITFP